MLGVRFAGDDAVYPIVVADGKGVGHFSGPPNNQGFRLLTHCCAFAIVGDELTLNMCAYYTYSSSGLGAALTLSAGDADIINEIRLIA